MSFCLELLHPAIDREKPHLDPILGDDQRLRIAVELVKLLPAVAAPARRAEQLVLCRETERAAGRIERLTEQRLPLVRRVERRRYAPARPPPAARCVRRSLSAGRSSRRPADAHKRHIHIVIVEGGEADALGGHIGRTLATASASTSHTTPRRMAIRFRRAPVSSFTRAFQSRRRSW
jgi:hypothetical protein